VNQRQKHQKENLESKEMVILLINIGGHDEVY
jgi:hypothetical protein